MAGGDGGVDRPKRSDLQGAFAQVVAAQDVSFSGDEKRRTRQKPRNCGRPDPGESARCAPQQPQLPSDLLMIQKPTALASVQAVLFLSPGSVVHGRLMRQLPDALLDYFDDDPVMLPQQMQGPLPPGLEIPLFILRKKDSGLHLSVSSSRMDFVFAPTRILSMETAIGPVFAEAGERLVAVRSASGLRVSRLAALATRVRETANPARELAEQFCLPSLLNGGPLNRPENFELHAHKTFTTAFGRRVNSWVRHKSALISATTAPAIVVEQDMNTVESGEEEATYTDENILQFFSEIASELNAAIDLYYPKISS